MLLPIFGHFFPSLWGTSEPLVSSLLFFSNAVPETQQASRVATIANYTCNKKNTQEGGSREGEPQVGPAPRRLATRERSQKFEVIRFGNLGSEGPKGGRRKGGRGRKLSHFSFCCAFRCCVVYSPCFPVWGEEKVMTIYDAGPLAAGPLCGLLNLGSETCGGYLAAKFLSSFPRKSRLRFCHRKLRHILHCKIRNFVTWSSLWQHPCLKIGS